MISSIKKPNFFIIGFPKAGTTSLASYLSENSSVYMSPVKEPHFFSEDLNFRQIVDGDSYMKLFSQAEENQLAVGEASTGYIFSKVAMNKILEYNHNAKFIIMIRNPIDMAFSLHSEYLQGGWENVPSFEEAWKLQDKRFNGQDIPLLCPEPKMLQYGKVCSLGMQVENVFSVVKKENIKIILFEDFCSNTLDVYKEVLQFIGAQYDGRIDFSVSNPGKSIRNKRLQAALNYLTRIKSKLFGHHFQFGLRAYISKCNSRPITSQGSTLEIEKELIDYFNNDINRLANLIDKDVSRWLKNR